jgi:hypothetical protein
MTMFCPIKFQFNASSISFSCSNRFFYLNITIVAPTFYDCCWLILFLLMKLLLKNYFLTLFQFLLFLKNFFNFPIYRLNFFRYLISAYLLRIHKSPNNYGKHYLQSIRKEHRLYQPKAHFTHFPLKLPCQLRKNHLKANQQIQHKPGNLPEY